MTGTGTAGGAGTIINAFATGKGIAFGLDLHVTARAEPAATQQVWDRRRRLGPREASVALVTARRIQDAVRRDETLRITVHSDIPPQRGLKSSSAVAVAVARAVLDHHHRTLPDARLLRIIADAAIESRTSLTGALDDAAACALGGVVFTDNARRRVLQRARLPEDLTAVLHVPKKKVATASLRRTDFKSLAPLIDEAWALAERGHVRDAMLINTIAYAPRLRIRPRFAMDALAAGAWAAGLSGKGPAQIALVPRWDAEEFAALAPHTRIVPLRHGGPPA